MYRITASRLQALKVSINFSIPGLESLSIRTRLLHLQSRGFHLISHLFFLLFPFLTFSDFCFFVSLMLVNRCYFLGADIKRLA